jgi:hypothetical protein
VEREKRRMEGEIRKANIPASAPAVSRYAEMIENKVRDRGSLSYNAFLNSSLRVAKYALRFS